SAVLGALAFVSVRRPWFGLWGGVVAFAALAHAAARWWYDELRVLERGALLPLFDNRVMHSRVVHQLYDAVAVATSVLLVRALAPIPPAGLTARAGSLGTPVLVAVFTVGGFSVAGLSRGSCLRSGVRRPFGVARSGV